METEQGPGAALLDTSVVIARPGRTIQLPDAAAISVITLGELRAGVVLARDEQVRGQRRRRFEAVRRTFAPLLVDEAVAERYGDVLAVARAERRTVKATDLLIVATALAHARILFTLDAAQAQLARAAALTVVGA